MAALKHKPIRPRRAGNRDHRVSACNGPFPQVNVTITHKKRSPGVGFPHPAVKTLFEAAIRQGITNRKGKVDVRRLGKASSLSWRMLYYAGDGANISLRALQQMADVVGYEIVARRAR